jgi:hypothetical protein
VHRDFESYERGSPLETLQQFEHLPVELMPLPILAPATAISK